MCVIEELFTCLQRIHLPKNVGFDTHRDVIITSNIIYDKIYNVLTRCLPTKTTIALNFVSAMLCDSEDNGLTKRRSLIQYARNMIRVSGCLTLMSNFFVNCMMHQETWKALCRCLAEVCRNSYENQNYCAHLIPTGVRRCRDGDMDSALVLQSLIHNHARNVQLFTLCKGLSIFNRQRLQVNACLQLLYEVTQNLDSTKLLKDNTNCEEILRDFVKLYGPDSRLGQWAIIILHNINLQINGLSIKVEKDDSFEDIKPLSDVIATKQKSYFNDTTRLLLNIRNEFMQCKTNHKKKIDNFNRNRNSSFLKNQHQPLTKMQTQNKINTSKVTNSQNMNYLHSNYINNMSFTFLLEKNLVSLRRKIYEKREDTTILLDHTVTNKKNIPNEFVKNTHSTNISTNQIYDQTSSNKYDVLHNELSMFDFKPTIVSTPKKVISISKINGSQNKKLINKFKRTRNCEKLNRKYRSNVRKKSITEVKHRSIGGRLFGAINDSCTMLVKTVKNIFQSGKNSEELQKTEEKSISENFDTNKQACSYSFTNYMRRRDAILGNKLSKEDSIISTVSTEIKGSESCETCNDTVVLKHKLVNDDHLKHTVKKLKLGINLYGCDFKKISAALWPRETYMTPHVLYNLYRKLIIK
ncbi:uncharacterized protein ACR2FA_012267 [Aphomia sociella]